MTETTLPHRAPADHPRGAYWDRFFWHLADGHIADPAEVQQTLLTSPDLHALSGNDRYAELVEWTVSFDKTLNMRAVYDELFPRRCFCRRCGTMDCNYLDFSGSNVFRTIYFSDACVSNTCDVLFRRTPDIDLIRCRDCGDIWLRGMDLDWGRQHLLLLEPGDLDRIERDGVWPSGMDQAEAIWSKDVSSMITHDDPRVTAWQAASNTADALARFGKARAS